MISYDMENLVTGRAIYGMDARLDGMVYASIEHPPVFGGKVKTLDDQEALKVAECARQLVSIPSSLRQRSSPLGGVAVIADNTWAAFQGRKKLQITWDNGPNESYDSVEYKKELRETAHKPGKVVRNVGDSEQASHSKKTLSKLITTFHCWPTLDGTHGGAGGIQGRKSHCVGANPKSAGCAGHCSSDSYSARECDLPCHVIRWRVWKKVQA